jgi:uncharacterized protein YdiU (UPF0061 family)
MQAVNPRFIPRNHLVEAALGAATDRADFMPFHDLLKVLANPYLEQPDAARYAAVPTPGEIVARTFCGT